jgi:hypothetical protein
MPGSTSAASSDAMPTMVARPVSSSFSHHPRAGQDIIGCHFIHGTRVKNTLHDIVRYTLRVPAGGAVFIICLRA